MNDKPRAKGLMKPRVRQGCYALVVLGAFAFAAGLRNAPARAWADLLMCNFYFLSLALSGIVFIAIQYLSKAGWSVMLRRIPEAMAGYLPVGAVLMGLVVFGGHDLYHWAHPNAAAHDAVLQAKSAYLNMPMFAGRMALFFVVWVAFARLLTGESIAQDKDGAVARTQRSVALSAAFLVVFCVTFSLASIDWIMSLEPHWYSTIFPWYVFSGVFVHGAAVVTLLLLLLRRRGCFPEANKHHFHDLGKYVFAFSVFWGYLWFSQYLLIWYSNIPEETAYYLARSVGTWPLLFWLNPVLNLGLPFVLLISMRAKQGRWRMPLVCGVLIAGHWLDLYLMCMPPVLGGAPVLGAVEILVFLGLGALFVLAFDRAFRRAAPLPRRDPYLVESLHHHQS